MVGKSVSFVKVLHDHEGKEGLLLLRNVAPNARGIRPAALELTGHAIGLKGAKILEGYFEKLKNLQIKNSSIAHGVRSIA